MWRGTACVRGVVCLSAATAHDSLVLCAAALEAQNCLHVYFAFHRATFFRSLSVSYIRLFVLLLLMLVADANFSVSILFSSFIKCLTALRFKSLNDRLATYLHASH